MAMVMAIMRNKIQQQHFGLRRSILACCIGVSCGLQAELRVTPTVASHLYAYGVKAGAATDTDRGAALDISPSLDISYQSSWLQSSFNIENQTITYRDAQRNNENLLSFRLNNKASFLADNLNVELGAGQTHRAAGGNLSRYTDAITGAEDLAQLDNQSALISYKNDRYDWAITSLSIGANRVNASQNVDIFDPLTDANQFSLNNKVFNADFQLQTRDRSRNFFWGFRGSSTKTERDTLESQFNRHGQGVIGVPFFWRVAMIAQGRYESNSNLQNVSSRFAEYRNYHSVGGGLEWKIGNRSWWNITYNTLNNATESKDYIGTAFELQPSRHTKLTGSLDRRFFGRTAEVTGSYRMQHLNMQLNVSDTVGSLLGLSGEDASTGLFICPPGVVPGLDACFQPPTAQYNPAQGERYYNVRLPGEDLNELLVVRRNISYQIGYDFNRLKLLTRFGQRKDDYLERTAVKDDKFVNFTANWQLNVRNSLSLSLDYSDLNYQSDGDLSGVNVASDLNGQLKSATLTLTRRINPKLTADANIRRIKVDYTGMDRDYQESRIWAGVKYQF